MRKIGETRLAGRMGCGRRFWLVGCFGRVIGDADLARGLVVFAMLLNEFDTLAGRESIKCTSRRVFVVANEWPLDPPMLCRALAC